MVRGLWSRKYFALREKNSGVSASGPSFFRPLCRQVRRPRQAVKSIVISQAAPVKFGHRLVLLLSLILFCFLSYFVYHTLRVSTSKRLQYPLVLNLGFSPCPQLLLHDAWASGKETSSGRRASLKSGFRRAQAALTCGIRPSYLGIFLPFLFALRIWVVSALSALCRGPY